MHSYASVSTLISHWISSFKVQSCAKTPHSSYSPFGNMILPLHSFSFNSHWFLWGKPSYMSLFLVRLAAGALWQVSQTNKHHWFNMERLEYGNFPGNVSRKNINKIKAQTDLHLFFHKFPLMFLLFTVF